MDFHIRVFRTPLTNALDLLHLQTAISLHHVSIHSCADHAVLGNSDFTYLASDMVP